MVLGVGQDTGTIFRVSGISDSSKKWDSGNAEDIESHGFLYSYRLCLCVCLCVSVSVCVFNILKACVIMSGNS